METESGQESPDRHGRATGSVDSGIADSSIAGSSEEGSELTEAPSQKPSAKKGHRGLKSAMAAAAVLLLAVGIWALTRSVSESDSGDPGQADSALIPQEDLQVDSSPIDEGIPAQTAEGYAEAPPEEITATDVVIGPSSSTELVKTGRMEIAVEDLGSATRQGSEAIEALGGFTAALEVQNSTTLPFASAAYRVPPESFDEAKSGLAQIGDVQSETSSVQDIATELADLDSRLQTLDVSIERLRGFLGESTDALAIGGLEAELTRRESEAASLRAQRKALDSQVEYATLNVTYSATVPVEPVSETRTGFAGGLSSGWDAATWVLRSAAAAFGFLLPFVPVLAVAALIVWLVRRSRRQSRAST